MPSKLRVAFGSTLRSLASRNRLAWRAGNPCPEPRMKEKST